MLERNAAIVYVGVMVGIIVFALLVGWTVFTALTDGTGPDQQSAEQAMGQRDKKQIQDIRYVRDERTDICYAFLRGMYSPPSITVVPCEKVEKYLEK